MDLAQNVMNQIKESLVNVFPGHFEYKGSGIYYFIQDGQKVFEIRINGQHKDKEQILAFFLEAQNNINTLLNELKGD